MSEPVIIGNATLYLGDCLDVMATLPAESVDAIVTDPPYGLAFMGKHRDHGVPGEDFWREALRVAKPGAHILAFGGTRTYHRLACAIEDAGWEIRDCVGWLYGSGFPKSLDISKALDRMAGAEREVIGPHPHVEKYHLHGQTAGQQKTIYQGGINGAANGGRMITAPSTEAARQWNGWGTALKPAHEPICLARKPLIGTVAENVLAHGTGGLNVDGCRVGTSKNVPASVSRKAHANCYMGGWKQYGETPGIGGHDPNLGRFPANIIHDGSDEVLAVFPETGPSKASARGGTNPNPMDWGKERSDGDTIKGHTDTGGTAARFFYTAKASREDREGSIHPTMKPTDLMRYLCRLITPPGGTVLDPFMGSGSTGKGCLLEGFRFIGIEREAEYLEIAAARIRKAQQQPDLFHQFDDPCAA